MLSAIPGAPQPHVGSDPKKTAMRAAAVELEASFLAEMLKSAGLEQTRDTFGGGAGEDQFGSFLIREQARLIAKAGGIGLAETLFNALMEKTDVT